MLRRDPLEDPVGVRVRTALELLGQSTTASSQSDKDPPAISALVPSPAHQTLANEAVDRARHGAGIQPESARQLAHRERPLSQERLEGHAARQADSEAALLVSLQRVDPLVGETEGFAKLLRQVVGENNCLLQ